MDASYGTVQREIDGDEDRCLGRMQTEIKRE